MPDLIKFGALFSTTYLEDISYILEKVGIYMENKKKFLSDVVEKSNDEEVLTSMKFEDSLDYRFNLIEEDALKRGLEEGTRLGLEQKTKETILSMIENNLPINIISKVTNKSIDEIKEIIDSIMNNFSFFLYYFMIILK